MAAGHWDLAATVRGYAVEDEVGRDAVEELAVDQAEDVVEVFEELFTNTDFTMKMPTKITVTEITSTSLTSSVH